MAREVKELTVKELEKTFQGIRQTGCVLVNYGGMKGDAARQVRQEMRRRGSRLMVVKNSLLATALERLGAGGLKSLIGGPTAVVYGENAIEAARAANAATEMCAAIKVRGAYVEGRVLGPEGVKKLASIPSREVLLATFAGALLAPLRRLAYGLLARPRALAYGLEQLKKGAAEQAPA